MSEVPLYTVPLFAVEALLEDLSVPDVTKRRIFFVFLITLKPRFE